MELQIPPFLLPHPARCCGNAEETQQRLVSWANRFRLSDGSREDAARFDAARPGWLTCWAYPYGDDQARQVVADWFAWYLIFDDVLDDTPDGRDVEHATSLVAILCAVFDDDGAEDREQPVRFGRALADVWRRSVPGMPTAWRQRFIGDFRRYLNAHLVQAQVNGGGIPLDEESYPSVRLDAGAMWPCIDMIEAVHGHAVDEELLNHPDVHVMREAAGNLVLWANDLLSAPKELNLGDLCNYVAVISYHRRVTLAESVKIVAEIINEETRRFLAAEARVHSELIDRIPVGQQRALRALLDGLSCWPSGNIEWAKQARRYQSRTVSRPEAFR